MLQRVTEDELRDTVPRDRRRTPVLGARGRGRLRARALARVDPRPRRPVGLDRDAHRAGPRPPGHGQPDRRRHRDRRLRARRRHRRRDAPTTPARRRWTSGSTRALVAAEYDPRARAARARGRQGHGRHRRRDRVRAGPDQRRPGAARASRSTSAASTRTRSAASRATSAAFASEAARATRDDGRVPAASDAGRRRRWTRASSRPSRPRRRRPASRFMLMPSGAAHDTMCVAERVPSAMVFVPCKDGISHSPARGREPGGRRTRRRDHPERDPLAADVTGAALRRPPSSP